MQLLVYSKNEPRDLGWWIRELGHSSALWYRYLVWTGLAGQTPELGSLI